MDGEYRFSDLEYGTYYVKEIAAPEGYLIVVDGTTAAVELNKNNSSAEVELTNERYAGGRIRITKTDDTDARKPLSGVEFTLTKQPEGTRKTATTDNNGVAEFKNLVAGIYEINETKAKFGYSGFNGPYYVKIVTAG